MGDIKLNTKQLIELKSLATFGDEGTVWPKADAAKFEKLGVAEIGGDAEGGVQIRINAAGREYLADMEPGNEKGVDTGNESGNNANQQAGNVTESKKPSGVKQEMFAIQSNIAIPTGPKRTRTSAYPFDKLEVGHSFFVPATEERPDPAKTMGSTVTAANQRHAEVVPGKFKTNRKHNEVPVTRQLRQFRMAPVADGAAWGEQFAGVSGAGVWRVEVDGTDVSEDSAE